MDNVVSCNDDEKLLLTKRTISRQLKRLRRVNPGVNMSPGELEFKLDLYFQVRRIIERSRKICV